MFVKSQGKNRLVNTAFVREFVIDKYFPVGETVATYTIVAVYPNGDTAIVSRKSTYEEAQAEIKELYDMLEFKTFV